MSWAAFVAKRVFGDRILKLLLRWGCDWRLGRQFVASVVRGQLLMLATVYFVGTTLERSARASRLTFFFGLLDWRVPPGGPGKRSKSLSSCRRSRRVGAFVFRGLCDEIGWKIGSDFWISGLVRVRVQKSLARDVRRALSRAA